MLWSQTGIKRWWVFMRNDFPKRFPFIRALNEESNTWAKSTVGAVNRQCKVLFTLLPHFPTWRTQYSLAPTITLIDRGKPTLWPMTPQQFPGEVLVERNHLTSTNLLGTWVSNLRDPSATVKPSNCCHEFNLMTQKWYYMTSVVT